MTAWLHIIGVGEAGVAELPASLRLLVNYAEAIIGPARFLAELTSVIEARPELTTPEQVERRSFDAIARALLEPAGTPDPVADDQPRLIEWQAPLASMIEQVTKLRDTPTVILATGDPMWFGIGASLARHLRPEEFAIYPHPSAFQLAAARQRWPLQHLAAISLHGRPIETLHQHLFPGSRILALTTDADTAQQAAELLVARGYGDSRLTALENLGSPDERSITATAAEIGSETLGDFYVLAIDCIPAPGAVLLPTVPGLPDDAFQSDGQLTKREVRAATLARLAPYPGALLWDVGAGCGSVAIEWMRAARDAEAIAFERDRDRLRMIAANAAALGVPTLRIEAGTAPHNLSGMPAPDAIFLGGGVADEALFEACWDALKPGGRLVANAVTLDGEQALYARRARLGGELVRIDIAVLDEIGGHEVLRPRLPVTQWSAEKPQQSVIVL
ncbi:MAG TPA: precorrin-6y C5,15-methyltransferase (decarboxylating) subunit CbiE [Devosiaceae bacterium]|jgi:precorrin-6Y C5,15-methyltransferase (decarboxylating)|nr:precorrin-6y C5,15-methyltransferase (decarboxylating) subunit CbiE [Devosiaceae bacterium]